MATDVRYMIDQDQQGDLVQIQDTADVIDHDLYQKEGASVLGQGLDLVKDIGVITDISHLFHHAKDHHHRLDHIVMKTVIHVVIEADVEAVVKVLKALQIHTETGTSILYVHYYKVDSENFHNY